MARGGLGDLLTALAGIQGRGGSPVPINIDGRGGDLKGGQPGGGRTPPYTPPGPTPPGTPPGRPITNPPTGPTTPPDRPRPGPAPHPVELPGPGNPPTPPGGGGPTTTPAPNDFNKGRVRPTQMPGDAYSPFMEALFGGVAPFNPYGGSGGGTSGGGGWSGGGSGSGGSGWGSAARAYSYDPLGIGQDNYYGGPYDDLPSSNENYYGMTGVNAATGYRGPARYGVVGGQGGYGVGMVGPEYSGPIFDDARGALKAMRRQRRLLEDQQSIQATAGAPTPAAATTTQPPAATAGGSNVDQKGGQPAGPNLLGRLGRINERLAADPNNAALQARQQRVASRIKGGQPAAGAPAAPTAPSAPAPQAAVAPVSGGLGTGLATGGAPQSYYEGSQFDTQFGNLVQSSVGNGNIYKRNGTDGSTLYHYDPRVGWKSMTQQEYQGYNNPADFYKDPNQYAAQAGGVKNEYEMRDGMWRTKLGTGTYA